MSGHNAFEDAEPPPSYEEAVAGSSRNDQRLRPQTPPTPPSGDDDNDNDNRRRRNRNKIYGVPASPLSPNGSPSSSRRLSRPAQTFQQLLSPTQNINRQFPPSFNLYRDALSRRVFFLGEHQATPLYSVTVPSGWGSRADVILHNGSREDSPPLAAVVYDPMGRRMEVNLPALTPGVPGRPSPVTTQMPSASRIKFTFRVEVPWSSGSVSGRRKEAFEWRRSDSVAVNRLGGRPLGWVLVRMNNELPSEAEGVAVGAGPPSGDGHEVVAACAETQMSWTKLWKFAFLGTGVSGALGERWAVMAVMTGLVAWDQDRRSG